MKNIVLYKSKYGNTLKYATWISETLGWELLDFSKFKKSDVHKYDKIIFGTAVYMGKMYQIKKALKTFKAKPIIIFTTGGNPGVPSEIKKITDKNLSEADLSKHQFFYLPAGVDFSKTKGLFKFVLKLMANSLEKKKNRTPEQDAILEGYKKPIVYVDKKYINEIVAFAKK